MVLEEAERATDAGRWAFGVVAYEAAAASDPVLAVHRVPVGGLPLVWFGDRPGLLPILQRGGLVEPGVGTLIPCSASR